MDHQQLVETTVRVQRSRRLLSSTIPSLGQSQADGNLDSEKASRKGKTPKDELDTDDDDNDEATNPRVWVVLQPLLNVITNIFTNDKLSDNTLSISSLVKTDFTSLELLGKGTSFIVRRLPDVPKGFTAGGDTASSRRVIDKHGSQQGSQKLVSKQLLATRWKHQKERSKQLLELVVNELQIITHHPLKMHENIIKFRGVMWEYDAELQVWPVPVLEYADFGTLSDFQARPLSLRFRTKMNLCLDIGNGLEALHLCGVIHGDVYSTPPISILTFIANQHW